jgi:hypothetical protein
MAAARLCPIHMPLHPKRPTHVERASDTCLPKLLLLLARSAQSQAMPTPQPTPPQLTSAGTSSGVSKTASMG